MPKKSRAELIAAMPQAEKDFIRLLIRIQLRVRRERQAKAASK